MKYLTIFAVLSLAAVSQFLVGGNRSHRVDFDINVVEGQEFLVSLMLDSTKIEQEKYIAKAEIRYSPDLLEAKAFIFGKDWIPFNRLGYGLINNKKGFLVKTAERYEQSPPPSMFGTAIFLAKKTGKGVLKIEGNTLVYNYNDQIVVDSNPVKFSINIFSDGTGVNIPNIEKKLPKQLFDINLEIDNYTVNSIKDLVSRVAFASFGTEPTSVDLVFSITDVLGNEIHSEKDNLIVETEVILTKKFEMMDLPAGKYTLALKTLYNVDPAKGRAGVSDEFRQDFEVAGEKNITPTALDSIWFWILVIVFVIVLVFMIASLAIFINRRVK
jgi:hypothetical protein